jgi:NAD(P)H-nitrite reductase large subunit
MRYLIIGNSAAAIGAVEGIRQVDHDSPVTIVSQEPYHTYSRPLISYLMQGKTDLAGIMYRPEGFYDDKGVELILGVAATSIDALSCQVSLADGRRLGYDRLLVATGSTPVRPDFDGLANVASVFGFQGLDDALALTEALNARHKQRVLIIGTGLVGLKCAEGLAKLAGSVTVVGRSGQVLTRVLDAQSAGMLQAHLQGSGIDVKLGSNVQSLTAEAATLASGEQIGFDILVLASGARPNTALLEGVARIEAGVVINSRSETTAAGVYAAGDLCQAIDVSSGEPAVMAVLPNAYMQGECAGINMAGGQAEFEAAMPMNATRLFGLSIITAGSYIGDDYLEAAEGRYKRLFHADDRLRGFIMVGDVEKAGIYASLIRERTPLSGIDFDLICQRPGLMAYTKEARGTMLAGGRR